MLPTKQSEHTCQKQRLAIRNNCNSSFCYSRKEFNSKVVITPHYRSTNNPSHLQPPSPPIVITLETEQRLLRALRLKRNYETLNHYAELRVSPFYEHFRRTVRAFYVYGEWGVGGDELQKIRQIRECEIGGRGTSRRLNYIDTPRSSCHIVVGEFYDFVCFFIQR